MEGVSAFIVGTSLVHPKSYTDVFYSMQFPNMSLKQDLRPHFLCCSSVEFYVEPMNSCIDDIDSMISNVDEMAFTEDIPVLPDDVSGFLDTIDCKQITPYPDYPGFVKLRRLGKMRYNWHYKKFQFEQVSSPSKFTRILMLSKNGESEHIAAEERYCTGPAIKLRDDSHIHFDIVYCIWCPQWPKEAKHWPYRRRKHGWPTAANIRKIVQSGCHVVNGKHPACRNDAFQCRLSFSVAEVILLHSWTPIQQIVYHMLRFVAKRELINKDCPKEDEVLSTYHFKTLMLWYCEEMPQDWWNSLSVIEICCCILRKVLEWLMMSYCPNYFIPQANLFHERMNKKVVIETTSRLNELCRSDILIDWFAEKYIRPILERIYFITDARYVMTDFGQCMLRICYIKDKEKLGCFDLQFSVGFFICLEQTLKDVIWKKRYAYLRHLQLLHGKIKEIQKTVVLGSILSTVEFSTSFLQFVKGLFSLHAANALGHQQITYDSNIITEFVREVSWQSKVLKSKHHNFPKPNRTSLDRSFVLFLTAQGLMKHLTGTISPLEFKLVFQMSNGLLQKVLECEDSKSKSIARATLAYMAALHFAASEYETAIDLCSRLILNKTTEEEENETMNAACLFYIEDIARIIGFYLLFKQIKYDFHYNRRLDLLDLRITPEVFATYLINLSKAKGHKECRHLCYLRTLAFPLDEILMAITNWKSYGISRRADSVSLVYQTSDPSNKSEKPDKSLLVNEKDIIESLTEYSLENLASFYNAICKDFGIRCYPVDCYRAAYRYKCLKYPEVLQLCERILEEPDLQSDLKEFVFANVIVMTPLDAYFDRDVQCLLGFHTLFCYMSARNEHLWKIKCLSESTFQNEFTKTIYLKTLVLPALIFCASGYSINCHYFIGRHFLARYLKTRCMMDCNSSCSEVMLEFKKLKINLPFEHMMRCILRKKCIQYYMQRLWHSL